MCRLLVCCRVHLGSPFNNVTRTPLSSACLLLKRTLSPHLTSQESIYLQTVAFPRINAAWLSNWTVHTVSVATISPHPPYSCMPPQRRGSHRLRQSHYGHCRNKSRSACHAASSRTPALPTWDISKSQQLRRPLSRFAHPAHRPGTAQILQSKRYLVHEK